MTKKPPQNLVDVTYDTAGRLSYESFKVSGGATTWQSAYGYDTAGNRSLALDAL